MSLPLVFFLGTFDKPLDLMAGSVGMHSHAHLALWHGINVPLIISTVVLLAGIAGVFVRKQLWAAFEGTKLVPRTGNEMLNLVQKWATSIGRFVGRMSDTHNPSRLMLPIVLLLLILAAAGLISDGTRVWLLGVVVAFGSWIAKETSDIEQGARCLWIFLPHGGR